MYPEDNLMHPRALRRLGQLSEEEIASLPHAGLEHEIQEVFQEAEDLLVGGLGAAGVEKLKADLMPWIHRGILVQSEYHVADTLASCTYFLSTLGSGPRPAATDPAALSEFSKLADHWHEVLKAHGVNVRQHMQNEKHIRKVRAAVDLCRATMAEGSPERWWVPGDFAYFDEYEGALGSRLVVHHALSQLTCEGFCTELRLPARYQVIATAEGGYVTPAPASDAPGSDHPAAGA